MRLDGIQTRVRSDAELAFIVMRALASARLLWARGGALPLEALASLVPVTHAAPTLTSFVPARLRAGTGPATLTLVGSGFDAFSVASWNGAANGCACASATGSKGGCRPIAP